MISLVSCKSGKVLPVKEAARIAHAGRGRVIVDCAQAAGHIPVDVRGIAPTRTPSSATSGCTGRSVSGALWIRDIDRFDSLRMGWRSQDAMDLEGNIALKPDASRFQTGTVDVAAYVGLRQALAVHRALGASARAHPIPARAIC